MKHIWFVFGLMLALLAAVPAASASYGHGYYGYGYDSYRYDGYGYYGDAQYRTYNYQDRRPYMVGNTIRYTGPNYRITRYGYRGNFEHRPEGYGLVRQGTPYPTSWTRGGQICGQQVPTTAHSSKWDGRNVRYNLLTGRSESNYRRTVYNKCRPTRTYDGSTYWWA